MLNSTDLEIAHEFKEKLIERGVPVSEFKVYGSRVRGDNTEDSDLDICLILKEASPEIEALISRLAWKVGFDHQRIITTVEYTPDNGIILQYVSRLLSKRSTRKEFLYEQ